MAQREIGHVGGIMADHLGMGKTVQMIGLCLISDRIYSLSNASQLRHRAAVAEGYRLLTVLKQMEKISVIANCSRINRPGQNLRVLISDTMKMITSKEIAYDCIRK
uniref:DNA repair protein RAD16 n=1 Tax=Lygus hesperus TaxID=30085 RepID=A0A0A9ZEY8_LYGHE